MRFPFLLLFSSFLVLLGLFATGCSTSPKPKAADTAASASSPKAAEQLKFVDVTKAAGLSGFHHETGAFGEKWMPETMGAGGGFIDYNGDQWIDVLLVGGAHWPSHTDQTVPALWLYKNNGDGTFTNKTKEAGLDKITTYGFGISVADYDNDGDQDFFLSTLYKNMLFRNDNGQFMEVGQQAGVTGDAAWSSSAIFLDADNDGHLDLYVGNYVRWSPQIDVWCTLDGQDKTYCAPGLYDGIPARFYHNNGDGTFTDKTKEAGLAGGPGKTLGVAELDYNRDGYSDLVVANDLERNLLYVNNGDGSFTERGMVSGIAFSENGKARGSMGIDTGTIGDNGSVSIFVGNFSGEMVGVYQHIGDGLFNDHSALSKVGQPSLRTLTFGLFLFDPDLDGDLDLFTANGHIRVKIDQQRQGINYRQPPELYLNRGDGTFKVIDHRPNDVFSTTLVGRGAAYGDIDRDGDEDILITENGGSAYLWRNEVKNNHFLRVRLRGTESNRQGIGSQITAYVGKRPISRRIKTGSSYLSQSEPAATFGLGEAKAVDSLVVHWPSGQVDRRINVPADQELILTEGSNQLAAN